MWHCTTCFSPITMRLDTTMRRGATMASITAIVITTARITTIATDLVGSV